VDASVLYFSFSLARRKPESYGCIRRVPVLGTDLVIKGRWWMVLISCDPGVTGALALFFGRGLIGVKDMPFDEIVTEAKGAGIRDLIGGPKVHKKHRLNPHRLAAVLREWSDGHGATLLREDVHPRGGQGAVTSGVLMESVGVVDGVCAALGIVVEKVDPSVWTRAMGINDVKRMSCERARREFPTWASVFTRVADHNRAEAALLGLYGVRRRSAGKSLPASV
jgi:crossover junction endodeoxyribonuclease RuvC